MKKNELTHIIREIVAEEVRRELPNAIAEVFKNFIGPKQSSTEKIEPQPVRIKQTVKEHIEETPSDLKRSLRDLFEGTNVMTPPKTKQAPKKLSNNPLLNEVLSQTRPFSPQERTGAPLGMGAMMAARQSGVPLNDRHPSPVMDDVITEEPGYLKNIPSMMPPVNEVPVSPIAQNVSQTQLLSDSHAPLAELPEGVSVMDVKGAVAEAAPSVANALTRNYSDFMKLVDKKQRRTV